jgi:hypothetical protein
MTDQKTYAVCRVEMIFADGGIIEFDVHNPSIRRSLSLGLNRKDSIRTDAELMKIRVMERRYYRGKVRADSVPYAVDKYYN